jgi:hypothetical protein
MQQAAKTARDRFIACPGGAPAPFDPDTDCSGRRPARDARRLMPATEGSSHACPVHRTGAVDPDVGRGAGSRRRQAARRTLSGRRPRYRRLPPHWCSRHRRQPGLRRRPRRLSASRRRARSGQKPGMKRACHSPLLGGLTGSIGSRGNPRTRRPRIGKAPPMKAVLPQHHLFTLIWINLATFPAVDCGIPHAPIAASDRPGSPQRPPPLVLSPQNHRGRTSRQPHQPVPAA